jgi:hypothetical protein
MPDTTGIPAPVAAVPAPNASPDGDFTPAAPPPGKIPKVLGLRERAPMREAKPGSLRADIHRILEESGRPMRRADVIARVAALRGVPVDHLLKAKVGEHLTNRHDPYVRRLAQGIYQFVPNTGGLQQCL